MSALMIVLLSQLNKPFHAVSKPTIEVWASLKRRFKAPHIARLLMSEAGKVAGAVADSKATELREETAAKFKAAKDFMEAECKTAGITMDDLSKDESKISAESLEKFDALMAEGHELKAKYEVEAKSEGRWTGLREEMDYFHGKATGKAIPWDTIDQRQAPARKTLGEQFTMSETYRGLLESGVLHSEGAKFMTERITGLGPLSEVVQLQDEYRAGDEKAGMKLAEMKAAADIITTDTEGAALILNQFLPGILNLPQRPLTVRELFTPGQATSDTISYAQQSAFESGAAAVAEADGTGGTPTGTTKPQSSIAWTRTTSPIETLATYMAATRQQLQDAPQTQSLIDGQGRLMLQLEEEDQLLSGNGSSPNLQGVRTETGVQTLAVDIGADADAAGINNLSALRTAKRMTMTGAARMSADAVLMHPADSESFDLLRDGNGLYRGGNPVGNFTFNQGLWGLQRVESEAMVEGEVLVGSFKGGASVLERMPITVYTTDSHDDWFIRNLIAVLFEERLGFPIFRPAAFVLITLTLWEGGS